MKDSEFIELLNLYLDHEISAADATRLEAEVSGNPARRRIYQEYCRMQKGCKLLALDSTSESGGVEDRKVIAFGPVRTSTSRRGVFYAASALAAAAACFSLIFGSRSRVEPVSSAPTIAVRGTPALPIAISPDRAGQPAIARMVTMPKPRDGLQATLTNHLSLRGKATGTVDSLFVSGDNSAAQFDWMRTLNFPPVQRVSAEQLRFEARSTPQPENRTYSSGQPLQDSVEMSAFRFQR